MTVRQAVLKIHLYLGLATGLVLTVVCFTGALLTFERELTEWMHPERYFAQGEGERLPLETLVERVGAAAPEAAIGGVSVYAEPGRTVEVQVMLPGERRATLYADPFTGAVIEQVVPQETGWHTIMALHRWLLGGDVGKLIVGVCVLVFLFILISGVWVWWPRSRNQLRARTRVTARHGWVRLNFDLHVSLGIFCAVFLFAMAFTGLMWSFKWFNAGMYAVAGDTAAPSPKPAPQPQAGRAHAALDAVHAAAVAAQPSPFYRIRVPEEPGGAFAVRVRTPDVAHDYASDVLFVDPYSAAVVARERYADRAGGARLRLWFHAIHFGDIGGWPTRVIWFVAVLLGATFPLTGTLIWFNRNRKRWRRRWRERRGAVDGA